MFFFTWKSAINAAIRDWVSGGNATIEKTWLGWIVTIQNKPLFKKEF
jgi:hypothetical protein